MRELAKKDEVVLSLRKSIEEMQCEVKEISEAKKAKDKENRELSNLNSCLDNQLARGHIETERLREEVDRLKQSLANYEEKIMYLENEQEKANHIIRNLLKRNKMK